jgi:post-segregation antitoxin (ccd killing protein)
MAALVSSAFDPSHAERALREEWRSSYVDISGAAAAPVGAELSRELALEWTRAAREARSSIAVHARFARELLSLAAPAALLSACARVMQDEVAHAQGCFSLARRFAGHDFAPEPLAADRPLDDDRSAIVLEVIARGCIRAAVAALSAREALEHCQDPATREVLMLRQGAKAQEAQLAWRFVAWSLRSAGPDLQDRARVAFLTALGSQAAPAPLGEHDRALLRYGVLGEAQRAALEQRVLRSAVLPCMENLLARRPARA